MATTSAKSTTTKKTVQKTAPAEALSDVIVNIGEDKIDLTEKTQGRIFIEDSALINVRNNTIGELFFIDPVTSEKISWSQSGEVLPLTMSTLRHMKTGAVKFFTNQLVIITGFADENALKYTPADIYTALYITQYYNDILDPADYEAVCRWTPEEIADKVKLMAAGARMKLVAMLNTYVEKGLLDSLRTIRAFETALECDLMRPQ